jgi:hypothetical protein
MNKLLKISNYKLLQNNQKLFLRMSSNYLISDPKYSFLKQLGLSELNDGAYNGKWFGNGEVIESICPSNNKPIAKVKQVMMLILKEL